MHTFKGCHALITGASSGIGRELARQLAPEAATLLLVARRQDRLEALKNELAHPGLTVLSYAVDLADDAQTDAFLTALGQSGRRVDFLINNAGLGDHGLFEESEWNRVKAMLDLNIKALTRLTHALLPGLVRSGRGAILNVSSIAGLLPLPKMAVYAATKAYVTSFSEALRAELRGTGVSVTALCPGPIETEFFEIAGRPNANEKAPAPEFFKVPVEQVAREALDAVIRDRARVIPGWLVCFVMTITTLVPIFLLRVFIAPGRR
ncbi:MAG: SDR family oxidoreductase [Verrucomicrobiota bacterium]|nr:SDR family oxidoreductase [Verrucomicrobiota bacterium]